MDAFTIARSPLSSLNLNGGSFGLGSRAASPFDTIPRGMDRTRGRRAPSFLSRGAPRDRRGRVAGKERGEAGLPTHTRRRGYCDNEHWQRVAGGPISAHGGR